MTHTCLYCGGIFSDQPGEGFGGRPCLCARKVSTPTVQTLRELVESWHKESNDSNWNGHIRTTYLACACALDRLLPDKSDK